MRTLAGAAVLVCGLAASGVAQQPAPAAVPVGTVTAERKPIARTAEFVGRVEAIDRVEVRARVTGYLEAVLFKEGDLVKEGQPLYRIEKGLFQAAVEQAEGALERSKAKKLLTAIQFERAEQLMKTSAGTVVARDQALTADRAAAGPDPDRPGQPRHREDQSRLHRHRRADRRQDRPDQCHQGQRRQPAERRADDDRQPGPDVCHCFRSASASSCARGRTRTRPTSTGIKVEAALCRRLDLRPGRQDQFRRRDGGSRDRHGAGARRFPEPVGRADRRPAGARSISRAGTPEEKVVVPQAALIADQEGVYVFVVEDGKAAIRRIKTGGDERRRT